MLLALLREMATKEDIEKLKADLKSYIDEKQHEYEGKRLVWCC